MKLRVLSFLLIFVAFLWLGYSLAGYSNTSDSPSPARKPTRLTALLIDGAANGVSDSAQAKIDLVRGGSSPSEHMLLATSFETITNPSKICEMLNLTYGLPATTARSCAIAALLENWSKVDPEAALVWSSARTTRLFGPLCESLAAQDVEFAKSWASRAGDEDLFGLMCVAVVDELAAEDLRGSLDVLASSESGLTREYVSKALADLAAADPHRLLQEVETMRPSIRSRGREAAAVALAASSPDEALDWWRQQSDASALGYAFLSELPPSHWEAGLDLASDIGTMESNTPHYSWARDEPEKFLDLAFGEQGEKYGLGIATTHAVEAWARKDLEGLRAWGEANLDNPEIVELVDRVLAEEQSVSAPEVPPRDLAEFVADPTSTAGHYLSLSTEERAAIASHVATMSSAEAGVLINAMEVNLHSVPLAQWTDILSSANLDDGETRAIAVNMAKRVVRRNSNIVPTETYEWARALPAGELRDAAVETAIQYLKIYDPAAASAAE